MPILMDLSATKECHCLAARRAARALTRRYDERLRRHGLRSTQFSILALLHIKGETRLGAIASMLGLERTTLTRSAALLEGNGWITAAPSQDARERRLRLTPAGRRKIEAAYADWKAVQDAIESERRTAPARTA